MNVILYSANYKASALDYARENRHAIEGSGSYTKYDVERYWDDYVQYMHAAIRQAGFTIDEQWTSYNPDKSPRNRPVYHSDSTNNIWADTRTMSWEEWFSHKR